MKSLEKYISPFTEQLFPDFYKEEGPMFIAFVKAYYEWMESYNESMYHARRLPDYRDIDKVIDDFIVFFKEKYLANIQFTTASNKQLFIKHSLDFYRAKGTPRAVDLYFKLIHGMQARTYYPGDDIFKLSDNEWVDIKYLEIEHTPGNVDLVGQTIKGTITGAEAFAERLVRVKTSTRFINILYIVNLTDDFKVGESIYIPSTTNTYLPKIQGSLTNLEIVIGGENFEVGETVYITGGLGRKSKGIVASVNNIIGGVSFELLDGGWGYSNTAEILLSEKVLRTDDMHNTNLDYFFHVTPFQQFETVTQNLGSLTYADAVDTWVVGDNVAIYDGGGNTTFEGTILQVVETTTGEGILTIDFANNSVAPANAETLYLEGNTNYANVQDYSDISATGNVIAFSETATFEYSTNTATTQLKAGDVIYQEDETMVFANAVVVNAYSNSISSQFYVNVTEIKGGFRPSKPVFKTATGANPDIGNDVSYNLLVQSNSTFGVVAVVNEFKSGGIIYGSNTANYGTLDFIYSYETAAEFTISNYENLGYLGETFSNTFIDPYANIELDAVAFGMPEDPTANLDSIIADAMLFQNTTIGSIQDIVLYNPGSGYGYDPFVVVHEPKLYHIEKYDLKIQLTANTSAGSFALGDYISGNTSSAYGKVVERDTSLNTLRVVRMSLDEEFLPGEYFYTEDLASKGLIEEVHALRREPRTGLNADIYGDAITSNGTISSVRVTDSGFGYYDQETVTLVSALDSTKTAVAVTSVEKQGIGEGYSRNRKSFLSTDKYIHDGEFYQEYSYQVLTALPFVTYADTLRKVLHVAGTRAYGSYVGTNESQIDIHPESSITIV